MESNGNKFNNRKFNLNFKKNHEFFYVRVFKYWKELPTQVVQPPSVGFKILSSGQD